MLEMREAAGAADSGSEGGGSGGGKKEQPPYTLLGQIGTWALFRHGHSDRLKVGLQFCSPNRLGLW